MSYLLSVIFYIFYTIFMYLIGTSVCKEERSDSFRLIVGYLIYTAIFSSATIPIQLYNCTWNLYRLWMFISIGICVCIILIQLIRRKKIILFPKGFKKLALDNIIFIILVVALIAMSYVDLGAVMSNNYQDDGYYLLKITTLPQMERPFWINPSTGIARRTFKIDTYLINTWYTEAAFYSDLFKINPVIFSKFGLASFNYYLFINAIHAVFEKSTKNTLSRYVPIIILLFTCFGLNRIRPIAFCFYKLQFSVFGYNLMQSIDGWQFTNAMNYGNIFVRTTGIFMCLMPFIMDEKFKFKHLVMYGVIAFVLMTKSTCSIPIIILLFIVCLFSKLLTNKKTILISVAILALTYALTYFLKGSTDVSTQAEEVLTANFKHGYLNYYLLLNSLFCIFYIWRKEKEMFVINLSMVLFTLFMFVEPFDKIADATSIYLWFVKSRTLEGAIYGLIILCFANILYLLKYLPKVKLVHTGLTVASVCIVGSYLLAYTPELNEATKYLEKNETGVISSTIELSYALNDLSNETDHQLNVLSFFRYTTEDDCSHFNAYMMRMYAPKIHSITSIYRYGNTTGNAFSTLNVWNNDLMRVFSYLDDGAFRQYFYDFLDQFPINCLVSRRDITDEIAERGFYLFRTIDASEYGFTYYIYFNPDIVDDNEYDPNYGYDDENWCFEFDQEDTPPEIIQIEEPEYEEIPEEVEEEEIIEEETPETQDKDDQEITEPDNPDPENPDNPNPDNPDNPNPDNPNPDNPNPGGSDNPNPGGNGDGNEGNENSNNGNVGSGDTPGILP